MVSSGNGGQGLAVFRMQYANSPFGPFQRPDEYKIKIYDTSITLPLLRATWKPETDTDLVVFVDQK